MKTETPPVIQLADYTAPHFSFVCALHYRRFKICEEGENEGKELGVVACSSFGREGTVFPLVKGDIIPTEFIFVKPIEHIKIE